VYPKPREAAMILVFFSMARWLSLQFSQRIEPFELKTTVVAQQFV
jgi:hypothetical protein